MDHQSPQATLHKKMPSLPPRPFFALPIFALWGRGARTRPGAQARSSHHR
jgi:hypothetical protein